MLQYASTPAMVVLPGSAAEVAAVVRRLLRGRDAVDGPRGRLGPVGGRNARGGRRPDRALADAQHPRGRPRQRSRSGRARGHEHRRLAGGRPEPLLPTGSVQPDRLHDRRQRGRELGRRALLQVRLHHELRDRPRTRAARRVADHGGRPRARPSGVRPDGRVRGLRGDARHRDGDLAAGGAHPGGRAHAGGVLRLDRAGRRGGVGDRLRSRSPRARSR